ncbi:SH3 domain-containing protein, partial [Streptococcus suis]
TYTNGEQFNYDSVYIADGYIWVSYISRSGVRRYVAAGEESNRRNVVPYGTFK